MLTFNDFIHKQNLKIEATSNIKIYQIFCAIGLNKVGISPRDGLFESDIGIVYLHATKGTHWVLCVSENQCDSCGCAPPQNLSKFNRKRYGYCLYSECKIHGLTSQ